VHDPSFIRFSFPYHGFYCYSTTCQIGISMVEKNLTWGILTSGLASIFFHRHVVPDEKHEPHHILSCSDMVYVDATSSSLFSLCAATLLGADDPLVVRPVSVRTVQPYPLDEAASPSEATRSKIGRPRGGRNNPKSTARVSSARNPRGSTSTDVFPPQMAHARQPLHPMKCSRTLLGVRKMAILEYRVGVRGQCLLKVFHSSSFYLILIPSIIFRIIYFYPVTDRLSSSAVPHAPHPVRGILLA
jgi:hypothetical protein